MPKDIHRPRALPKAFLAMSRRSRARAQRFLAISLLRQRACVCAPEHELAFWVIKQAIVDLGYSRERIHALDFFETNVDDYCTVVKLDPDYVRRVLKRYALTEAEQRDTPAKRSDRSAPRAIHGHDPRVPRTQRISAYGPAGTMAAAH